MKPVIQTILCPCALGLRWEEVLVFALSLAERYDAKVSVLHVIEPLSPTTKGLIESEALAPIRREAMAKIEADLKLQVGRQLEAVKVDDPLAGDRVVDIKVEEGFPGRFILKRAASMGADLIVMGTHDHSVVGELLGSVARRVVHASPIPVVLVPLRGSS